MTSDHLRRLRVIGAGLVTAAVQDHPDAMVKLRGVTVAADFRNTDRPMSMLECFQLGQSCAALARDCGAVTEARDLLLDAEAVTEFLALAHRGHY